MEPATLPTPTSGMWAPYEAPEIGEKLDTLYQVGSFVLLEATVRDAVEVEVEPGKKKMREPVDLRVQTTDANVQRVFSGFAAGIVGMAKRVTPGDLPAVCRIVDQPTQRGTTRVLELVKLIPAGADVAAIAASLAVPMMPIQAQDDAS